MKNVYACLIGEWVCLNDDPTCTVGEKGQDPLTWFEEGADIYSPKTREPDTYYEIDYVNVYYKNKKYRVNPVLIQYVED